MTGLLITSGIIWLLTAIVQGFNLWTIGALVSTLMFCGKKVAYFCKFQHLVAIEIICAILTICIQLLFKRFSLVKFLITIAVRLIFLGIALYDKTVYTYFTETRRKEE